MSGEEDHPQTICHLFASPLQGESRLFKELATAEKIFPTQSLLAIGLDKGKGPLKGRLQDRYRYELIRLRSAGLPRILPFQLIKFAEWTFRAAGRARASGARIIHCHSLPALPAAVLAARLAHAKIVYDAHELESRRANFSKLKQRAAEVLEALLMRFVDELLVVSPSIEKYYRKTYTGTNISLLMNIPLAQTSATGLDFRERHQIKRDDFVVIYVGGFAPSRGIELLLKAFDGLGEPYHLIFLGHGALARTIEEAQTRQSNIHLIGSVQESEVVPTVAFANLSFCVINCDSLSYRFSLPNKYFQSLMAGVPVAVNTLNVDMLALGQDSGMVFGLEYSSEAVRNFIIDFRARHEKRTPQPWSWEAQEDVLISAYRRIL